MGTIWSQTFISLFYCLALWWRKCRSRPWAVWIVSEAVSIRFLGQASRPDERVCVGGNWTDERKLTHSFESIPRFEGPPCLLARQEHQLKKQNTPLHHYPPFCLFYKGIFQWPMTDHLIKWYLFFFFCWNLARYSSLSFSPLTLPLPFFHTPYRIYALCSSLSLWQPRPDEGTWRCWATACSTGSVELSPGCQFSGIQHRSRRPKPSTHASLFLLTQVQKQHSAMYVVAVDHRLSAAVVIHCPVLSELFHKSVWKCSWKNLWTNLLPI